MFFGKVKIDGHFKPVIVNNYVFCRVFPPGELFWLFKNFNSVKFNRRGGANKPRGGGNISLKSIDRGGPSIRFMRVCSYYVLYCILGFFFCSQFIFAVDNFFQTLEGYLQIHSLGLFLHVLILIIGIFLVLISAQTCIEKYLSWISDFMSTFNVCYFFNILWKY